MSTLNSVLSHSMHHGMPHRLTRPEPSAVSPRAGSLSRTLRWHMNQIWMALEGQGQRRAAPELLRAAGRLQDSEPEVAAHLHAVARAWMAH